MADIELIKLKKVYDNGYVAVKPSDLKINDKEFMVLVGPSGCGKTTSLRMIAGLESISDGEIRIGGRRVNEVQPKNRDIAMVFQSYALYPHLTVYENMAFALRLRKVPPREIHEQIVQAAEMLSLTSQLEKLPKALSGGQRQRVALGRAIVRKPQAFLFDEPLSNLDAKLRGEMRYELRSLQQRLATTAVYVTHDQIEAMTLGDRITVMSVGEIQQVAPPRVVYDWPFNRFVAGFIGTPPMNFLPGILKDAGGSWSAQIAGHAVPLAMPNRDNLGKARDSEIVMGIRPENLHVAANAPAGSPSMDMKIDVVEHMGDHQYVYLRADGLPDTIIMKAPGAVELAVGQVARIHLDTTRAHIFQGRGEHAPNITLPPGFPQQQ
ncbi:MAG: sn-glycerol-3-phosphate ABC transporter ATP-binding protein UgpC [Planctomycetes bacterium]|nr:sn-glycerol-3-phosphate ABC transporter ATP-binding protein UgpC [Planctomycetota bacterium]